MSEEQLIELTYNIVLCGLGDFMGTSAYLSKLSDDERNMFFNIVESFSGCNLDLKVDYEKVQKFVMTIYKFSEEYLKSKGIELPPETKGHHSFR